MYLLKGFRFGMLLQLAVGPMCLLVFQTAANQGFLMGMVLVLSIALVDGIYIVLSALGVGAAMKNKKAQTKIKIFGCLILVIFGLNMILGALEISFLPEILLFSKIQPENLFIKGLLLTGSNPLTILFWSGVFSSQAIENQYTKKELRWFGAGCVLSTLLFLTLVSLLGTFMGSFFSKTVSMILNIAVGILLILFGIKLIISFPLRKKDLS